MKYNDSQGAKARVSEMMRYLDDCDGTEGMEAVDQRKLVQYCFAAQEYFLKTIKEQYNLIYLFLNVYYTKLKLLLCHTSQIQIHLIYNN